MKLYQVGGCVRDALLGKEAHDRDWVVVGARPETLLAAGFRQVGADFPVFLHPETGEEYAMARQERKVGAGYHGFLVDTENVSLDEDLSRRDLTINAMALDESGTLVDPFHGQMDLRAKVLRHVSPAFAEDPLRILRVLRFHARFGPDWTIHPTTQVLMADMVARGEADHLTAERVWKEVARALMEPHPELFLLGLKLFGLLSRPPFEAYRDLAADFPAMLTPEQGGPRLPARFALAFGSTRHRQPAPGIPLEVLRVSALWAEIKDTGWFAHPQIDPVAALGFFQRVGLFKESDFLDDILEAALSLGRDTLRLEQTATLVRAVDTRAISSTMPPGPAVGAAIQHARLLAIQLTAIPTL